MKSERGTALTAGLSAAAMALALAAPARAQQDTINVLAGYEAEQGFELMFDGMNASSFRDRFVNYTRNNTTNTNLHQGWTVNTTLDDPDRPGAVFGAVVNGAANIDIRSRKLYRDFDWRFEYRNNGNQGVIYRFDVSGAYPWETGIEFAIDNDLNTNVLFQTGAAYDLIAPSSQPYHVRSSDKWNSLRIVAKGDSVEHWMNGVKVVSFRYWSDAFLDAYDRPSKWTGYSRFCQTAPNNRTFIPEGYLGLQGDHGGAWQIRRMRILHDSTETQDRVQLGPVDTAGSTAIRLGHTGAAGDYRIASAPGILRISSGASALRSVEVRELDGRLAHRTRVAPGTAEQSLDVSGLRQGVYLVRVESATSVHTARALVH